MQRVELIDEQFLNMLESTILTPEVLLTFTENPLRKSRKVSKKGSEMVETG